MNTLTPILSATAADILNSGWWLILAALGIPTAVIGLLFRRMEKKMEKRDKQREEKEANREQLDLMLLQATSAAIALGEATAKAVQRIPDAHCNGDMHAALEYATEVKHKQKDFLTSLGVHALHED